MPGSSNLKGKDLQLSASGGMTLEFHYKGDKTTIVGTGIMIFLYVRLFPFNLKDWVWYQRI